MLAIGTAARTRCSAASMPAATWAAVSVARTAIFAATRIESGLMCTVRMWMTRSTSGPSSSAATIFRCISALAASPISKLFISTARIAAAAASSTPMASEPAPSHWPLPVSADSVTPANANASPIRAARSSSRTTGSSGALVRRMKVPQFRSPRTLLASLTPVRSEKPSSTADRARTIRATRGERIGSGFRILCRPSYTEKAAPTVNSITDTTNP